MTSRHETLIRLYMRAELLSEMLEGYLDEVFIAGFHETGVSQGADDALKAMYHVIDNLQIRIDIEEDKERDRT